MMRLNLVLLGAVLASAFYLVHTQYESRRLYAAIDKQNALARQLNVEHEQLQVQKREQAASARVQQLAVRRLQMRPVNPAITQYVTLPSGSVQPSASTGQEVRP